VDDPLGLNPANSSTPKVKLDYLSLQEAILKLTQENELPKRSNSQSQEEIRRKTGLGGEAVSPKGLGRGI
jgi:hypothetical protein